MHKDEELYIHLLCFLLQISRASLTPESSHIAKPAASWLDDFLVWMSPEAFGCCRKFINGSYCPPDDQVAHVLFFLQDITLTISSLTSYYKLVFMDVYGDIISLLDKPDFVLPNFYLICTVQRTKIITFLSNIDLLLVFFITGNLKVVFIYLFFVLNI